MVNTWMNKTALLNILLYARNLDIFIFQLQFKFLTKRNIEL